MAHRHLILFAAPLLAQEFHNPVVIPNSARTDRGTLEFRTANDQRGVKLRSASSMAGDYTMDLPDALGASGDCLKLIATSVLGFGACGFGGGWTLTADELSPVDTSATLRLIRSTAGQGIGSFAKPWSGVWSSTFQAPNAAGTDAKMTLNSSSLTGADTAGNTTISMLFNSGFVSISGTFRGNGIVGQDTDVLHVLKNAALSSSNWRWAISHRADGRQLWFYGYDGSNFSIPLKLNPTGNSVCVNCSGDATPGFSLDVGGQILTTGIRADGNSGYVNAAQIEIRSSNPVSGNSLHFGFRGDIANIPGERHVTLQDEQSNPLMRWASYIAPNFATPTITAFAHLNPSTDNARDLGSASNYWRVIRGITVRAHDLYPTDSTADIGIGGPLLPLNAAHNLGSATLRWGTAFVTNVNISGTCTGCPAGNWITTASTIYPSSTSSALEVIANPSSGGQVLGTLAAPWTGATANQFSTPNPSGTAARTSISSATLSMKTSGGTETVNINSSSGNMVLQGNIQLPIMGGSGSVHACFDAAGNFYRGTVSGC